MLKGEKINDLELCEVALLMEFLKKNNPLMLVFSDAELLNSFVAKVTGQNLFESEEEIKDFTNPCWNMKG